MNGLMDRNWIDNNIILEYKDVIDILLIVE